MMKFKIASAHQSLASAVVALMRPVLANPALAALAFASVGLHFIDRPPPATPGLGGDMILLTQALGLGSTVANACWGLSQDHRVGRIAVGVIERLLMTLLFLYYLGIHCDEINSNVAFRGYELITYFAYSGLFLGALQVSVTALFDRSRLESQTPPGALVSVKGVDLHPLSRSAGASPVPPADLHTTCVHEVGHLLLYKATDPLPAGVEVSVKTHRSPHDTIAGQVRRGLDSTKPSKITKPYLHWTMLLTLAGTAAEEVVLGEAYAGSRSDYINWLVTAKFYLECGFGPVFYPGADTDEEMANNRLVINTLHQEHRDLLRELMTLNRDWILRTADLLLVEHRFDTQRAQELLQFAVLPATMRPIDVQRRVDDGLGQENDS